MNNPKKGAINTQDVLAMRGEGYYSERTAGARNVINDAGVIGIPSKKWGESPLAVIVRADDSLSEQDVMDHCVGKLAPFKTVKAVEFIDVIPRNASGKILKRELRDIYDYEAND